MRNIIFILILCMLPLAFATDVYELNQPLDLKFACDDGGSYCNHSTSCNITILYPNSDLLVNNQQMQRLGVLFNYTVPDTSVAGTYNYFIVCSALTSIYESDYTLTSIKGSEASKLPFILEVLFFVVFLLALTYLLNEGEFGLLKLGNILFSIFFLMLIPAAFTTLNYTQSFYRLSMGYLIFFLAYATVHIIYWSLIKLGLVVPKKGDAFE
jgi:hypothetical protein